jgi:hypothetical protein
MYVVPALTLLALCLQSIATQLLYAAFVIMIHDHHEISCMEYFKRLYRRTFWIPWCLMLIAWYTWLWQYQAIYADHSIYFVSFYILVWLFVATYFHILVQWCITSFNNPSCKRLILFNSVVQTWALLGTIIVTAGILLLIYAVFLFVT